VVHLRCTRDVYQEFVNDHKYRPLFEAQWEVLRFAVFPTALAILREAVREYAKLACIPGRDLSLLYGIPTLTCYKVLSPPDLEDDTVATDAEIQSLEKLVDEKSLLYFKNIKEGGGVFRFFGGGPFGIENQRSVRNSWSLCGLHGEITLPDWVGIREEIWRLRSPWTDGLVGLFASVQEELLSQWRALPADTLLLERGLRERGLNFRPVVIPANGDTQTNNGVRVSAQSTEDVSRKKTSRNAPNMSKPGRKPKLSKDFVYRAGSLWRDAVMVNNTKVSTDQLKDIAAVLDAGEYLLPGIYLEGRYGNELRDYNSRNSNSNRGPVKTWSRLVSLGDKDHVRGMRRLLSRCARMLDDSRRGLSGN